MKKGTECAKGAMGAAAMRGAWKKKKAAIDEE